MTNLAREAHGVLTRSASGTTTKHKTRSSNDEPHILIVDDESCDGWNWAGVLRRAGFRLSIAPDSSDGWHAFHVRTYALLIASQDSKGRAGLELIEKVRAVSDHIPCILIWERTAPDASNMDRLLHPGIALEKPVSNARLIATVRGLLCADHEHVNRSSKTAC